MTSGSANEISVCAGVEPGYSFKGSRPKGLIFIKKFKFSRT